MSSDASALMLLDVMVEAGERLAVLVHESSPESIEHDWRTFDAICLGLIRIGEAAKALPDALKQARPDVPWSIVVALRDRIAHGYESLQARRIWDIASLSVPALVAAVRDLRRELEDGA